FGPVLSERRCPSDSPPRALARRCAGALRSRGSFAALTRLSCRAGLRACLIREALPLGLPPPPSRAPLRRRAPFAWLVRCAHSPLLSRGPSGLSYPRGVAPRTPPPALSRAAAPARSVRVARSLRSLASPVARAFGPVLSER